MQKVNRRWGSGCDLYLPVRMLRLNDIRKWTAWLQMQEQDKRKLERLSDDDCVPIRGGDRVGTVNS
jgi:hypothetical protein